MNKIRVLSDDLVNQIAAGEVVERPASVVKELVENSIDAGATIILIKLEGGGKRLIEVADNGCGMPTDDALLALERHATSKIKYSQDLDNIVTLGFRGEALPSIAAVSRMKIVTSLPETVGGTEIEIAAGKIQDVKEVGAPTGTVISVRNLFYNVPARLKFLKTQATELSHINQIITKLALAHPSLHFKLTHQEKALLDLPPQLHLRDRIASLFGTGVAKELLVVDYQEGAIQLKGMISPPSLHRASRDYQFSFVNHRPIQNKTIAQASTLAYHQLLANKRHPVWFVFIKLNPGMVDVNVHPTKLEVRFHNHKQVYHLIENGFRQTLKTANLFPRQNLGPLPSHAKEIYKERIKDTITTYQTAIQYKPEGKKDYSITKNMEPRPTSKPVFPKSDFSFIENEIFSQAQTDNAAHCRQPSPVKEKEHFWQGLSPIGQLHETYLICQNKEELVILDQHAAHERIVYEQLVNKLKRQEQLDSQRLLFPIQLQLNPRQHPLLEEQLPFFEKLGFELALFGNNTLVVQAAPSFLASNQITSSIEDILDELTSLGKLPEATKIKDTILERLACHSAIRANQPLPAEEIRALLQQLGEANLPFTCPHGRPTAIRFSLNELAKRFKRT